MLQVETPEELEILEAAVRTYLFRHRGKQAVIRPTFKELVEVIFAVFDRSKVWGDIVYNEDAIDKHIETIRHIQNFDGPPQTVGYPQIANADVKNLSAISDELFIGSLVNRYLDGFAYPHIRAMWTLLPVLMFRNKGREVGIKGYDPEQDILDFVEKYPFFAGLPNHARTHSVQTPPATIEGPSLLGGSKIWLIGTGDNKDKFWDSFYKNGIVAIGWNELGNLDEYNSESDIQRSLTKFNPDTTNEIRASQVWQFAHTIKRGDLVFARYGSKVFGLGIVLSGYQYSETENFEGRNFHHFCRVAWINTDPVQLPGQDDWKSNMFTLRELAKDNAYYPVFKQVVDNTLNNLGLPGVLQSLTDHSVTKTGQASSVAKLPNLVKDNSTPELTLGYWWFNANIAVWDVESAMNGEEKVITSYNEKGYKRRIYRNFENAKKGDKIIAYVTAPNRYVATELTVQEELGTRDGVEGIVVRKVGNLSKPVTHARIRYSDELSDLKPIKSPIGTLFRLTAEEYETILGLADTAEDDAHHNLPAYSIKDEMDKLFVDEDFVNKCINNLKRKKNIILQGPPGVGKSYIAKKLAWELIGRVDDRKIARVQFHQSFGYEEFIHGYRPTTKGGFALQQGIFLKFVYEAHADPGTPHVFIIDEINRGNLSRILGECMSTIEHDKRDEAHGVQLLHTASHEPKFWIPENLYIIGMMNTADRSISLVDYALRRRFAFIDLEPQFDKDKFTSLLKVGSDEEKTQIKNRFTSLNKNIANESRLGNKYRIGHSYFCTENGLPEGKTFNSWYNEIIEHEIKPLLHSYLPDDQEGVEDLLLLVRSQQS